MLKTHSKHQTTILLGIVILLSIFVRWLSVRDNHLIFWFDQSRDAYVARQIIENKDLKILGPSASGTNDTVYHGVLYYYFIAPFYTFSGGNPMIPTMALSILGSLGIIPLFYFTKRIFSSEEVAYIAIISYLFSIESIQLAHWLSNPSLAITPLIIYFWSIWEVGYKNNKSFIIPLALMLGILLQSAVWFIYLLGPLLIATLYNLDRFTKKSVLNNKKNVFIFSSIVLFCISTIIAGQLILWKNGVFSLSNLHTSTAVANGQTVLKLLEVYFLKMIQSMSPAFPVASLFLILTSLIGLMKLKKDIQIFFLAWLTGPFWLFLIEPRNNIHILMSIEIALIMLLSYILFYEWKKNRIVPKIIVIGLFLTFITGNLLMMKRYRSLSSSIFSQQQGTNLHDQIELIDFTYAIANGSDFTFSAFTNPNGYYITWAYLYDWYGKNKYGYVPTFVGPDQTGLFGENLLPRMDVSNADIHFTIIEPNLDIVPRITKNLFIAEQNRIGPVVSKKVFGSTQIEFRSVKVK